jgi:soluble lytic murein transglycosylase
LRRAQSLVSVGRFSEALVSARDVKEPLASQEEAALAVADALAGTGDRVAAVAQWRALLAAQPHGLRWVDTSLQLARALLDGVDGPPASRAKEIIDRMTRVIVEAPVVAEKLGASDLRTAAAAAEGGSAPPPLTTDERLRQAQAWLEASQPKKAHEAAALVLDHCPLGSKAAASTACKAATVVAQAIPHGKYAEAADAWGTAITRCEGDDTLVTALYLGAKASASAKRPAEALSRFAQVEARFPKHRLADDARLRSAMLVLEQGDEARALSMLSSLPDSYPEGDMQNEGLFRAALVNLAAHDLPSAGASLDRVLARGPEPAGSPTAGRTEYFRARVAELAGDPTDAKARYVAAIRAVPLSYYMLLAYARLRAMDAALAQSTVEASMKAEPPGPFLTRDHPVLGSAAFETFVRLLQVGEVDAARRQASACGVFADGVDPEVLWAVASLYNHAGAVEIGHALARTRLVDYRAHFPAGRWRVAWEIAYPRAWAGLVTRESETARVPAPLTWAIMREESAFNPEAKSAAGALGLMQLMPSTAKRVAADASIPWDDAALRRPEVSIALGASLLGSLREAFAGRPLLAVAAYNGGPVAVRRWVAERGDEDVDLFVERIPFDETRAYVKRVLASEAAYAALYAPGSLESLVAW